MFGQPISSLSTPLQCSEALTDNYRKLYSRSLSHRGAAATAVHCREDIEILKYGEMSLQAEFEQRAKDVKNVKSRPTDQELLDVYGLYKQAIVGDINIDKPGMMDMKGKAKWEAWNSRKEMSKEDAMTAYITLAKEIINKYGM